MIPPTNSMPRRKGPPAALRLQTPVQNPQIVLALGTDSASASAGSSAVDDLDLFPFRSSTNKPPSLRNMKRLSLTLPLDDSSTNSWLISSSTASQSTSHTTPDGSLDKLRPRRQSVASLFTTSTNPLLHRKEEDGSPTVPYVDGPVQVIPGIWLGSEENARDWKGLIERGIKTILNVAKEVTSPFDSAAAQPFRPFASTPNLYKKALEPHRQANSTFYPAHLANGRPGMHYLKLEWSHGETDLVQKGFPAAMAFVDAALEREEGVLIHCQCGISRSATLVIALVMRAAALCTPSVPPEVWALKGYQEAYSFVKAKSKWVGPNMSLIYQLLEYERAIKSGNASPSLSQKSSAAAEEEEWGRRRRLMDEAPSDSEEFDHESIEAREARALDKAMEDRVVARKSSTSSMTSSGVGMGPAWRSRYSDRKRAGSVASNMTSTGSVLSENLVEEDEEEELLDVGGGFDSASSRHRSSSGELESCSISSESPCDVLPITLRAIPFTPLTARPLATPQPPPSAPISQTSFQTPAAPSSAAKSSFNPSSPPSSRGAKVKRRPPPLGLLPPVPSSPMSAVAPASAQPIPPRPRTESRRPSSPPFHLRRSQKLSLPTTKTKQMPPTLLTPSQMFFVFPPDSAPTARTPSTMTLTSNMTNAVPFPTASTPRISTFRSHGRTRSFIGLGVPPTPTTACSRVDAKGWIGLE